MSSQKWYPTSETCQDLQTITLLERRIYEAMVSFQHEQKLDHAMTEKLRPNFLNRFRWAYSQITTDEKEQVEQP